MRNLAASKSKDSAVERAGINHGLLSYALVDEGLGKDLLADFQPKDGKILMAESGWPTASRRFPNSSRKGTSRA
jgi:hypothetical protein